MCTTGYAIAAMLFHVQGANKAVPVVVYVDNVENALWLVLQWMPTVGFVINDLWHVEERFKKPLPDIPAKCKSSTCFTKHIMLC